MDLIELIKNANDNDVLMSAGASGYEHGCHYREPGIISEKEYKEYCKELGTGVHANLGYPVALKSDGKVIAITGYKGLPSTDIYDWEMGSSSFTATITTTTTTGE